MRSVLPPPPAKRPCPIGTAIHLQATRDPDAPAVSIGSSEMTRSELDHLSDAIARGLLAQGVQRDDLVTICLPTGVAHHAVAFAIWKVGATPNPVSPRLPDKELREIVSAASPRLIVGLKGTELEGVPIFTPASLEADGGPLPLIEPARYFRATTSGGSTGRSKIIVAHQPAIVDLNGPWLGLTNDDVILHPAPLFHAAPFVQTNFALCWGAHVIEMERFDPLEWLRLVQLHRVRWAYLVPTMMTRILAVPEAEREAFDVSSLEIIIHMAASCPPDIKRQWIAWVGADVVWEMYSGSENVGVTVISGREWLERPGSVGRHWAGGDIDIVDDEGRILPAGEIGEIRFRSASEAPGYHYLGASKTHDENNSYGDLGWLDNAGYLFIADRRTDMFTVGGANVYPAQVEAVLDSHPQILSSIVVGLPDDDMGNRVHAIVQIEGRAADLNLEQFRHYLSANLDRLKTPATMEIVDCPLRDDSGKARRLSLRDDAILRRVAGASFVPLN